MSDPQKPPRKVRSPSPSPSLPDRPTGPLQVQACHPRRALLRRSGYVAFPRCVSVLMPFISTQDSQETHTHVPVRPPRRARNTRLSLRATPSKAHLRRPLPSLSLEALQTLLSPRHRPHPPHDFKGKSPVLSPSLLRGPRRAVQRGGFSQLGYWSC